MKIKEQLIDYIKRNVFKCKNEIGIVKWNCIDLRNGDSFEFDNKKDAIETFCSLWSLLNEDEKNRA